MILIIEDDPVARQLLQRLAQRLRRECCTAETGAEAIAQLGRLPIGLVLCDIALPDMPGFDVIARMRERPHLADIPVVFCSSHAELPTVQQALALGAVDFIKKPIEPGPVHTRLERAVARIPRRWETWREVRARFGGDAAAYRELLGLTRAEMAMLVEELGVGAPAERLTSRLADVRSACLQVGAARAAALIADLGADAAADPDAARRLRDGLVVEMAGFDRLVAAEAARPGSPAA